MEDKIQKQFRYTNRIPIDNITALRNITGKEPNDYVILLGKDKSLDGDARQYTWLATSDASDDGDNIIKPSSYILGELGRWHRVDIVSSADGTFKGQKSVVIGNGTSTDYYITHTFNTLDVTVEVYKLTDDAPTNPYETVEVGVHRTLGGIVIVFKEPPTALEEFKVLIITF